MTNSKIPSRLTALNLKFDKPTQKKQKILFISDHPLSTSGVGVQANLLIRGLLQTGRYSFRCLGGAIEHENYDTVMVDGNPDYVIKPTNGFGDHQMIRQILFTERPDAIVIFTDPRQFMWLWEIEDEIHDVCPIAYWHVWDNDPYPAFNDVWYQSTDLINCLSYKTYEMVKEHFPEKTNYIPHAFPKEVYHPVGDFQISQLRSNFLKGKEDWFVGLWVNRNATRKMPNDVINAFKLFLENLEKKEGHRKAAMIMHTDPFDKEGPNLSVVSDMLGMGQHVWFSRDKLGFSDMNNLHNMVDYTINISKAEGFGLSTLISMQCARPIIASYTGGMIRQVEDYRDGSFNGICIKPAARTLIGSQGVPYIYDDHVNYEDVAKGMMELYEMGDAKRRELGYKASAYVDHEFVFGKMISEWDRTLTECINKFNKEKKTVKRWDVSKLTPQPTEQDMKPVQTISQRKPKVK